MQKLIISQLNVKQKIFPETEFRGIKKKIQKYIQNNRNIKSLIIGISGGQDSTLTAKICQSAISEIRKKKSSSVFLIALRMPFGKQIDEKDCEKAINFINPDKIIKIDIKSIVENTISVLKKKNIPINEKIKGNLKSRERAKIEYLISNIYSGIVVGTLNACELVTGYFTKYGDNAVDINPIIHLNKRQGKKILQYLKCPEILYKKTPMSGLEDSFPFVSDEKAIGISYKNIDRYLEGKKIKKEYEKIIENLYLYSLHKRNVVFKI
ncbi:ammonia-dependent NAD(+) synthetase [bacterium endosymbiont of Pedicinus badii]|uniref:ammonia-dependent NAD(+) synthetase n=1 Tax=bacterium endosymbiont of Pedicinus badii TaxID=1719126 RepID=UPI0009BB2BED|nr:ammonia-dependent NAD(+) synthetase [bacterium endosymbiont of Pedicinus badii]OQM34384.1 NAD synthetase [bacterium endosymbiont of Pedicinus badii]